MTMRRALPHVIALLLGVGAALLVACGGATVKGGIPAASAGELKDQLAAVQRTVSNHHCSGVAGQLSQVDDGIDSLPGTVDGKLRRSLSQASALLRQTAIEECKPTTTPTHTQTQTTRTQTQTQTTATQTQTQPAQTQTAPPVTTTTPATTQPPSTTTITPPPPPVQPPAPVPPPAPAPAPGGSGGGATPQVP